MPEQQQFRDDDSSFNMTKIIAPIKRENSRTIKETNEEERRILGLPLYPSTRGKLINKNNKCNSSQYHGNSPLAGSPKSFNMQKALVHSKKNKGLLRMKPRATFATFDNRNQPYVDEPQINGQVMVDEAESGNENFTIKSSAAFSKSHSTGNIFDGKHYSNNNRWSDTKPQTTHGQRRNSFMKLIKEEQEFGGTGAGDDNNKINYPAYMVNEERKGYMTNQNWFSSKDIANVTDIDDDAMTHKLKSTTKSHHDEKDNEQKVDRKIISGNKFVNETRHSFPLKHSY